MKRFIFLSLISLFIFSCSEYDDDGLPSEPGNIVITNPDGTKKVKRITGISDIPDQGDISMSTYSVINYAQDSYSYVDSLYLNYDFELPDMPDIPDMDFPLDGLVVSAANVRDNVPVEKIVTYNIPGIDNERLVFEYENNRIISNTHYIGNQITYSSTYTYNDDNIVFNKQYSDNQMGDESMIFQLQDGQIMSFTYTPSNSNSEYTVDLTRSGVNITQAQINMNGNNHDIVYSYDNANIYFHNLGNDINDSRNSMELISFTETDFDESPMVIIDHMEGLIRNAARWGNHNLTSVRVDGDIYMTTIHVYDSDNYPIEFEQTLRAISDAGMDTETILTGNIFYYE